MMQSQPQYVIQQQKNWTSTIVAATIALLVAVPLTAFIVSSIVRAQSEAQIAYLDQRLAQVAPVSYNHPASSDRWVAGDNCVAPEGGKGAGAELFSASVLDMSREGGFRAGDVSWIVSGGRGAGHVAAGGHGVKHVEHKVVHEKTEHHAHHSTSNVYHQNTTHNTNSHNVNSNNGVTNNTDINTGDDARIDVENDTEITNNNHSFNDDSYNTEDSYNNEETNINDSYNSTETDVDDSFNDNSTNDSFNDNSTTDNSIDESFNEESSIDESFNEETTVEAEEDVVVVPPVLL